MSVGIGPIEILILLILAGVVFMLFRRLSGGGRGKQGDDLGDY